MNRRLVCQLPLSMLLASCGGGGGWTEVAFSEQTMNLFRPFAAGEYVWRTADQMRAGIAAAPFRVFPVGLVTEEPPEPALDFTTSMVIGLSLGIGKWCFAPRIVRVLRDGDDTQLEYRVPTISTLACLRDGPAIAFASVPKAPGRVWFRAVEG